MDQAAKSCAGIRGWAEWVPGGELGSSECLNENPVDPQAGASSCAAGGAAASGAGCLSAASLSAEGDAAMHDSEGTDHLQEEEEEEEEEGQATSAVDPAPSRELPAQILNSILYSNSMQYAVDTSQYSETVQSTYTRV